MTSNEEQVRALSQLRSRRGFERAEASGLFSDKATLAHAVAQARHPVTCAYLLPFSRKPASRSQASRWMTLSRVSCPA